MSVSPGTVLFPVMPIPLRMPVIAMFFNGPALNVCGTAVESGCVIDGEANGAGAAAAGAAAGACAGAAGAAAAGAEDAGAVWSCAEEPGSAGSPGVGEEAVSSDAVVAFGAVVPAAVVICCCVAD